MSDCSACGGTGFTLSMEPCTHGAAPHTFAAPDWLPPLTSAHPPPSVYDYDEPPIVVPTPTIHKAAPKAATPKQEEFIRRLIAERDPSLPAAVAATMLLKDGVMTAKAASNIIDALMETPATKKAPRPNTYDGTCTTCGAHVAAKAGRIEQIDGIWRPFHLDGECPTGDDLAAVLADRVTEPGIYRKDGQFFRVKAGRYDKSTFWAERIYVPDHSPSVAFIRAGKAIFLKASDKITLAEARAFGVAVGSCINCGYTLDGEDGKSLTAGYGATCSKNNGWPYPSTADMKAIAAGMTTWDELLAVRA